MNVTSQSPSGDTSRRTILVGSGVALATTIAGPSQAAIPGRNIKAAGAQHVGPYITTKDGVQIYYKDWGPGTGSPSCSTTAGR